MVKGGQLYDHKAKEKSLEEVLGWKDSDNLGNKHPHRAGAQLEGPWGQWWVAVVRASAELLCRFHWKV